MQQLLTVEVIYRFFGEPLYLYGLAAVPLAVLFLWYSRVRRRSAMARLGDEELLGRLTESVNSRGRRWRSILWVSALAMLIVAVARPQWGTEVRVTEQKGLQLMVALDISESMLAQDMKPDRLTRAKLEMLELVGRLRGDEVGLVLFSGASFIQFPLTFDYSTARIFLEGANPSLISRRGTALAGAIETSLTAFDAEREGQKVLLLLTDGESHEGDSIKAARRAARSGVVIYTVGFGSDRGEPIPIYNRLGQVSGFKEDADGATVLTRLEEGTLRGVAEQTGGQYFRASQGRITEALVTEFGKLEKASLQSEVEIVRVERFQWFLLATLMMLMASELIPERLRRRRPEHVPEAA
ncbi:MAG: VWA domain-containing protein [Chloroflexi bacterium]|nr:VWA domain-containing protein [Chloroflexota bacterium]MCI0840815.1 VWA domain-containing protein [Chloroflexota bacterium]